MGGPRFDCWLARPTTLRLLRQLVRLDYTPLTRARTGIRALHCRHRRAVAVNAGFAGHVEEVDAGATASLREQDEIPRVWRIVASSGTNEMAIRRAADTLSLILHKDYRSKLISHSDDLMQAVTSEYDVILHESNVAAPALLGKLLIDLPSNEKNWKAWTQILQFRHRVNGLRGVEDVFHGIRMRNLEWPVHGDDADTLWTTFFNSFISEASEDTHLRTLQRLTAHAKYLKDMRNQVVQNLYLRIIGRFLRVAPGSKTVGSFPVIAWHYRLTRDGWYEPGLVRDLVLDTLQSIDKRSAFHKFGLIYNIAAENNCYDHCMPLVFQHAAEAEVLEWHQFLTSHSDLPSEDYAKDPAIALLLRNTLDGDTRDAATRRSMTRKSRGKRNLVVPELTRASMNGLLGEVHGIQPKTISDSFCAKLFATLAFSIDFVIRSLRFLSITSLGPLSVRELAFRCATASEFFDRIAQIQQTEIQLTDCMYTRMLRRLGAKAQDDLFQALLLSDQHPENYDDEHIQQSLLAGFLESEDWLQVHLTLFCLSQADETMAGAAWNRLLQHYARIQNWREVGHVFDHLKAENLFVTLRSLNFLKKYFLPARKRGKRDAEAPPEYLRYCDLVINAGMYAAEHGQLVPAFFWVELLKRCGMRDSMNRLERIALWLAHQYREESRDALRVSLKKRPIYLSRKEILKEIFSNNMIRAIVVWGFRNASIRYLLRPIDDREKEKIYASAVWKAMGDRPEHQPWARGLLLLSRLKQAGVEVPMKVVRQGLRQCLWTIFGPAVSVKNVTFNAMRNNRLTLAQYVQHANEVWEQGIFPVPPRMLKDDSAQGQAALLCRIFGKHPPVRRKDGEFADLQGWVTTGGHTQKRVMFLTPRQRFMMWRHSPLQWKRRRQRQAESVPVTTYTPSTFHLSPKNDNDDDPISSLQRPRPAAPPLNSHPQSTRSDTPAPP